MTNSSWNNASVLPRVRVIALAIGVLASLRCLALYLMQPEAFFAGYLTGWLFWLSVALGCLAFHLIHNLTGGAWGYFTRPVFEASNETLLYFAITFLPLLLGLGTLYAWSDPEAVKADPILTAKADYLNVSAWLLRTVAYFATWVVVGLAVIRWSSTDDPRARARLEARRSIISGPGLILLGLAATFASIDWIMSLDAHWYSTMYGVIFLAGCAVSGLSFAIMALALLTGDEGDRSPRLADLFQDLGNLLLTAVIFWAYVTYMQYLIIWSGNLEELSPYYVVRSQGGWQFVALLLAVFHFAVPFACLLSRRLKRRPRRLALVALLLFVMRFVDCMWLVAPSVAVPGLAVLGSAVAAWLTVGGVWLAIFAWRLEARLRWPAEAPYPAGAKLHEQSRLEAT